MWPPAGVSARRATSKPTPSSATVRRTVAPASSRTSTAEAAECSATLRTASWATRNTSSAVLSPTSTASGTWRRTSMPRPASGSSRSRRAAGRPARCRAGRVDLDQQGAQGADAAPQGLGAAVQGLGLLLVALGGGLGVGADQGVVGRGQVLGDPVVEVAGDPAALGVGGLHGPAQQPFPLAQAGVQPAGGRPGQRQLEQLEQQQGPDGDGQELAPHGAGGGDGQVGLEQAALVALEPVLRADRSLSSAATVLSRSTSCSSMARG